MVLPQNRASTILKQQYEQLTFDPEQVHAELLEMLKKKSSKFMMGGRSHTYTHEDPIFFRQGPIENAQQKATKKCPSCHHVFQDRGEMVFCSFCGNSNDSKCMQKTKIYPHAAKDPETGKPTQRGPICKVCTHKFFVRERVNKVVQQINAAKVSMSQGLINLEKQGLEAKTLCQQEQDNNLDTDHKIQEVVSENAQIYNETKKLREESKNKKKENAKILAQKDALENDVRKMENETEDLENVYKELLLVSNEMRAIRRNQTATNDANGSVDFGFSGTPRNNRMDARSELSGDMLMDDVPEDIYGLADGE